jgi:hypothetical protein
MTIENAQAALTSSFEMVPRTGFIPYTDGILDAESGTVKALGTSSWRALTGSSWGQTKTYIQTYNKLRWTAPLIDLGAIQYFTLNIEAEFTGSLSYLIYVSETGAFAGEETEYYVKDGDYNVAGFYGRYCYVTAVLEGIELIKILITANTAIKEYRIPNVNSATLAGTLGNRQIALPTPVSLIKDIHIQPKAATSYAVNLYVSDTATSEILIPVIKSKTNTTATFALYGIDNDPRDGVVDITVTALPRQAMFGGNLVVLE